MIKATYRAGKRRGVILGLIAEDWHRLCRRELIHVHVEELDVPNVDIVILGGEHLADVLNQIEPGIGPDTVLK